MSAFRLLWRWTIVPFLDAVVLFALLLDAGAGPWFACAGGFALLCVLWAIGRIAELILGA